MQSSITDDLSCFSSLSQQDQLHQQTDETSLGIKPLPQLKVTGHLIHVNKGASFVIP